jgi:FAD binding domain
MGKDRIHSVPVAIVGAGPAGLVAAVMLARYGSGCCWWGGTPACRRCRGPPASAPGPWSCCGPGGWRSRSAPESWAWSTPARGPPTRSPRPAASCSPAASRTASRRRPSAGRRWRPCPRTTWSPCCSGTCGRTRPPRSASAPSWSASTTTRRAPPWCCATAPPAGRRSPAPATWSAPTARTPPSAPVSASPWTAPTTWPSTSRCCSRPRWARSWAAAATASTSSSTPRPAACSSQRRGGPLALRPEVGAGPRAAGGLPEARLEDYPRPGWRTSSAPRPASPTCNCGSWPWGASRSRPRSPSATATAALSWPATPPTA